jgi:hypothetical protein
VQLMEFFDRWVTPTGVQRDQQVTGPTFIGLTDLNPVPQFTQNLGPANGGYLVAVVKFQG